MNNLLGHLQFWSLVIFSDSDAQGQVREEGSTTYNSKSQTEFALKFGIKIIADLKIRMNPARSSKKVDNLLVTTT